MNAWKEVKVGDLGKVLTGKTPKTSETDNYGGDIPFITPSDDMTAKYIYSTNKKLTKKGALSVKNNIIPERAICVSCIGSDLGKVVISTERSVTNQQINSIIINEAKYDVDYIYYVMTMLGKTMNHHSKTSTAVPIVNKSQFSEYTFLCPELKVQKKIGEILSSIDSKIMNNEAINRNLVEQAKTLYKEMIIDSSDDKWTEGMLSDIAVITMGQSPSGDSYNEEGNGEVFYQGRGEFGERFPTRRLFTTEPKRMAEANDVLMSVRAPVGDLNVAYEACCIGRGLGAIHSKDGHQSYVLYTLFSLADAFDIYNGEGTVFGSINKDALNKMSINVPPKEVMDKFEFLVAPLDLVIRKNYEEMCRLVELRDVLLSKLMSGELDVSELEV